MENQEWRTCRHVETGVLQTGAQGAYVFGALPYAMQALPCLGAQCCECVVWGLVMPGLAGQRGYPLGCYCAHGIGHLPQLQLACLCSIITRYR